MKSADSDPVRMTVWFRFPAPILPTVSQWEGMMSSAFSLAIVGYVINLAMGRTLAAKHGYDINPNQVQTMKYIDISLSGLWIARFSIVI